MLTFSEALVQLKSGDDMRCKAWSPRAFVRAKVVNGAPALVVYQRDNNPHTPEQTPYTYPSAEVFGQDWSKA